MSFEDVVAEQVVLSGIIRYGYDAFVDVDDLVQPHDLSEDVNQYLLTIFQDHFKDGDARQLDIPTILSTAEKIGLGRHFTKDEETKYLRALINYSKNVELSSVRPSAAKLLKLKVGRDLDEVLHSTRNDLRKITGEEALELILARVENPILEYTQGLNEDRLNTTTQIADGGREWLEEVFANPSENIGIPLPWETWNEQVGGGCSEGGVTVIAARPKSGKAGFIDSNVYTPNGPIRMGDIKLGDEVCNPYGGTSKVIAIHPQGERDAYKVEFSDGDFTLCDENHLWRVKLYREYGKWKVASTKELMTDLKTKCDNWPRFKWRVQLTEPCYYTKQKQNVNPYLLGYIIGNGSITTGSIEIVAPDKETVERLKTMIDLKNYDLRYAERFKYLLVKRKGGIGSRNEYITELRKLGLWGTSSHTKFIPSSYKYSSIEDRWAVFQGWCDADGGGTTCPNGTTTVEGSTTSEHLANDIKELVQSLGGLCKIVPRQTRYEQDGEWFDSFRLHIRFNDNSQCFRLTRKKNITTIRTKKPLKRELCSIEFMGKMETQCITLDSEDGLYLTDHHIVTHNSVAANECCFHTADTLGLPSLNVDTEMKLSDQRFRLLAHNTGIPINDIKFGRLTDEQRDILRTTMEKLESIPYHYKPVADLSFEEQLAAIRRWVLKEVPFDESGKRKRALVVYDYLQISDASEFKGDFKEYQMLGFQMMSLIRLAIKYNIAILAFVQLNREGDNDESTTSVAGSDRIIWKCASYSILKRKSEEEIAWDGLANGTRKLLNIVSRFGEGGDGNYINLIFEGKTARLIEGKTRNQLLKERGSKPSNEQTFGKPPATKYKNKKKTDSNAPNLTF